MYEKAIGNDEDETDSFYSVLMYPDGKVEVTDAVTEHTEDSESILEIGFCTGFNIDFDPDECVMYDNDMRDEYEDRYDEDEVEGNAYNFLKKYHPEKIKEYQEVANDNFLDNLNTDYMYNEVIEDIERMKQYRDEVLRI